MRRARVNGLCLSYEQLGQGAEIVLIHGLGANLACWYIPIMRPLSRAFRATAYDLRGHGASDMPPSGYSTAQMAEDVRCLLDALEISQAHLVGHSFGGAVALHVAALYPERVASLTLADAIIRAFQPSSALKNWPHWRIFRDRYRRLGVTIDEEAEIDFRLLAVLGGVERRAGREMGMFLPFQNWSGGRRARRRWQQLLSTTTAEAEFKQIAGLTPAAIRSVQQPALAVYGAYSHTLLSCRGLEEHLPHVKTLIVPGVGHFHPFLKPTLFVEKVWEFVSDVTS